MIIFNASVHPIMGGIEILVRISNGYIHIYIYIRIILNIWYQDHILKNCVIYYT